MDEKTQIEIELKALRSKITELEQKNYKLEQIIRDNDLEDVDVSLSDEEIICINEIRNLKQLSNQGMFGKEEAQILDILHKNLRMIRGQSVDNSKKKGKKADIKELFKIVEGEPNG